MADVFAGVLVGAEGFARPVAIKRMVPELCRIPAFGRLFVREARLAALLHHPNIISVLDFDRDHEDRYFLVMEFIDGVDLRRLADTGRLPPHVSAYIVAEVLGALTHAHEFVSDDRPVGIIHRDVSPHNIMLSWDGGVKLVDFGIATAIAATGLSFVNSLGGDAEARGKLAYMSPEQALGVELDGRSDVFACGIILHELLTGRRLFAAADRRATLARVLEARIPSPRLKVPEVPNDLEAVCMRMLARDRRRRHLSARQALCELLDCDCISPRAGMDLRALLARRFAGGASPHRFDDRLLDEPDTLAAPWFLSQRSVPLLPSRLMLTGNDIEAAMIAPTRTAPRPTRDRLSRRDDRRAAQPHGSAEKPRLSPLRWIGGALLVSGLAIAITLCTAGRRSSTRATVSTAVDARASTFSAQSRAGKGPSTAGVNDHAAPETGDGGHTTTADASTRSPRESFGELVVTARPWANVYVDGTFRGRTPMRLSLPQGIHRIRLGYPETGATYRRRIRLVGGAEKTIFHSW